MLVGLAVKSIMPGRARKNQPTPKSKIAAEEIPTTLRRAVNAASFAAWIQQKKQYSDEGGAPALTRLTPPLFGLDAKVTATPF